MQGLLLVTLRVVGPAFAAPVASAQSEITIDFSMAPQAPRAVRERLLRGTRDRLHLGLILSRSMNDHTVQWP